MGQTHQTCVCKLGLQWNIPTFPNIDEKGCHNASSEDTIYILMNSCIDYFMCLHVCTRVEEGEMHSMI